MDTAVLICPVGPSQQKAKASATDTAVSPSASRTPQKENALPNLRESSPLQGLSELQSPQPLQQPCLPVADSPQGQVLSKTTPRGHHRLSCMPAASSSLVVHQLDRDTATAEQQAFWVGRSPAAADGTEVAGSLIRQEDRGNTAAAEEDVCRQLEGLQLTPLAQLLKLCGQQVVMVVIRTV